MRFVQKVALLFGFAFVAAAITGFVTGGMSMDAHMSSAAKLGGFFPVNVLHNGVHLIFGVWGLLAARSIRGARTYCLLSGALYLVLAGLGFIIPDVFGLIPIGGNDIALHGAFGVILTAFGAATSMEAAPAGAEA